MALRVLGNQEARLVVENKSEAKLRDLSVEVCGQHFTLGDVAPGGSARVRIEKYTDSDWFITGRWEDGVPIREHVGYITHGMSFDDQIVFGSDRKVKYTSHPK